MPIALLQPRYLKEASLLAQNARKLLHRRKDVMSERSCSDVESEIDKLETAIQAQNESAVKEATERVDAMFSKVHPHRADAGWRENCEVLLVAFIIAIAVRAYFLQPFKIPTGSMEPTLNGIVGHKVEPTQPLPGQVESFLESIWLGRSYVDAVSAVDDQVINMAPIKQWLFLSYTRIDCASGHSYLVHAPMETLRNDSDGFGVHPGRSYLAGQPIAYGYVDTGDQVFVDKFTYHFRSPKRGEVFVFNTAGIRGIEERLRMTDPDVKSQFYIKRLGGVPGDTLRIDQPRLFINGELAQEPGFRRVMSLTDGYRGYSNFSVFEYLSTPQDEFVVPPSSYFALGDNSFNSSDSRAWGRVPAENVVGRGLFVYWPFTRHWGLIH